MNYLARRLFSMPYLSSLGRWLPLLLWMAIIFAVSHTPKQDIPAFGTWDMLIKKGSHFLAYFILALLAHWAIAHPGRQPWGRYIWVWLIAVAYAISDEYHQTFIPGRNGNMSDVVIDSLGALTALLVLAYYEKWRGSLFW
jgi:VanZ family protein